MLSIRSTQMEKLNAYSENRYQSDLCRHLAQYDPVLCGAAGFEALEKAVDSWLLQARKCGFTLEGSIQTFLEIIIVLGSEFYQDPQYFWLTPWLQPRENVQEMDRSRYLHFHSARYLDEVDGIDRSLGVTALRKAQQVTRNQLNEIGGYTPENVVSWIESINPLKCRFIGTEALHVLFQLAGKQAGQVKLPSPAGISLVFLLMFTFGSGILRDPMYSWVTRALASQDVKSEEPSDENRLRRLHEQFQTYQT